MHKERYEKWLEKATEYREELEGIAGNEAEIEDRFHQDLEFGTAGLRGKMGGGTNRINLYTIRKATAGLAEFIVSEGDYAKERGVAIAFDSRNNSDILAMECAKVLAGYGINAYIYEELRSTPQLSFTVRHLSTIAGIMITASHNPKEYNGYKCYWEDGGQMPPKVSDVLLRTISEIDEFDVRIQNSGFRIQDFIHTIGEDIDNAYLDAVWVKSIRKGGDLAITYTPLHGAGLTPVWETLKQNGFRNINLVLEQIEPNGDFPTAPYPNPEKEECWALAIEAASTAQSDIIIATDPDSDRVGVMARNSRGQMKKLNGNQVGILLTEYVLSNVTLPPDPAVVSTIVSSRVTKKICEAHGVAYFDVYTGFKNIAEKILEFEEKNSHNFVMGWEESIGYLVGDYCRDKDAIVAAMLICQMAQDQKDRGKTLWDYLDEIYAKYGARIEETIDLTKEGLDGAKEINAIMEGYRTNPPTNIGGIKIDSIIDYKKATAPANVISLQLESGSEICVRPSGTEPKIKFYFSAINAEELKTLKEGMF
ncbi:MAG: phospho-sugar mutase [Oscillospiraceae bacterium]|nr:phospho-sugar mutase [Oscillospiraceae bacterium]